jgi:predicted NUDIX family NTP pyrophosphohydrolase
MTKQSAGILLYRFKNKMPEFFLVHPGGPFWAKKDDGAWSIPKGEFTDEESALDAARREFKEEIGIELEGNFLELTPIKQKSGKTVFGWALQYDFDPSTIVSNTFEIEWPPKSGKMKSFPEVDRGEWFGIQKAKEKINAAQVPLIDELVKKIKNTL